MSQIVKHMIQSLISITIFKLLMQRSIVYSITQVVTHHYKRFSSSKYMYQMQVQAQQKCFTRLIQKNRISYTMVNEFMFLSKLQHIH